MKSTEDIELSFEFYPPRSEESRNNLWNTIDRLRRFDPQYVSVTFGAGGTTKEPTYDTVRGIVEDFSVNTVPHLSCLGSTEEEIKDILEQYSELGVAGIMALRGDLPQDVDDSQAFTEKGDFEYANQLVEFIGEQFPEFDIHVAAYPEFHPEAPQPTTDMQNFVRKANSGADTAVTQYFYNNLAYYQFVEEVNRMGVDIPIIPGIMPLTNYEKIRQFSELCGAEIPLWIEKRMREYEGDPDSQEKLGIEIATRQIEDLLEQGAPGIHLYTLNKALATSEILSRLGW